MNESKRNTSIDLKPVKLVLPPEKGTLPNLNKSTPHFIHEIETIGYKVIGVNFFIPQQKKIQLHPYYTTVCPLYTGFN